MKNVSFQQAAELGFTFPEGRGWITNGNRVRLAQDAALVTTPNTAVPAELTAYYDPKVIEILTAPRNARKAFPEVKKGDWSTKYFKFSAQELTGATQPYDDYADGVTAGVNVEWFTRENYVFQTSIAYGDQETAVSAQARISLAATKQRAAASAIEIDANKFALLGVADHNIYGILNDPNLPSATSVTTWNGKTSEVIFTDIINSLFGSLASNSSGLIDNNSPLKLLVSPAMNVKLGTTNAFGITVMDMLNKYFSNLEVVVIPEMYSASSGEKIMMVCTEINGQHTAELPFGEKMRAGRVIPHLSSFAQKFVASTYGGVIYYPFAFATITGMDAEGTAGSGYNIYLNAEAVTATAETVTATAGTVTATAGTVTATAGTINNTATTVNATATTVNVTPSPAG